MRAQVTLIPTESKRLIAKAVAKMDEVQNAVSDGTVAIHPSSSTIFIVEELIGEVPPTEVWVCGLIAPKAACVSAEVTGVRSEGDTGARTLTPSEFTYTWVIEKGKLKSGLPLADILKQMGPEDVYIKGVNAIDPNTTVGVLIGNRVEGGTIGLVISQSKLRGFRLVFPVGLEKMIPITVKQAAEEAASRDSLDYSMGIPCSLLPCEGIVVTEPRAIEILTGATAVPISAGGIGGAEGAITMVVKGGVGQVTRAIEYIEMVKGTQLPREVRVADCKDCVNQICNLSSGDKSWR